MSKPMNVNHLQRQTIKGGKNLQTVMLIVVGQLNFHLNQLIVDHENDQYTYTQW